jgi:hypothetical protein
MTADAEPDAGEPLVSITPEPHAPHPRLRVVLRGRINGDDVVEAFLGLYAEQPATVLYDRLFDLTRYEGGFELPHLQRIAVAYAQANRHPQHPCRTAFVTHDPHFPLWTPSMNHQFKGRQLRAFSSLREAERFLDEPMAERARAEAS